jgi:signal transduction histidine kinase
VALDNRASDWSAWDDAYNYVQGKNTKGFEKANFLPETLKILNLDFYAFYDLKRNAIRKEKFDKASGKFQKFPESLSQTLQNGNFFSFQPGENSHRGIVKIPEGLLMFTLRPIYNSKLTGPSKGYVFMGRLINSDVTKKISGILNREVSILEPEAAAKDYNVNLQKNVALKEASQNLIYGLAVVRDFNNIPVAVLKSPLPRKILEIGTTSYKKTLTFFTAFTIFLSFAILSVLDRLVIKRLWSLDLQVNRLNQPGMTELAVSGNDEVARLARSMNQMLRTLQSRNAELMDLNEIIQNQNQALVTAAKMSALGEMAGGVAHEINTPLTVIKLRSEMIMDELAEISAPNPVKLRLALEGIAGTVDRSTKIVQSLRAFSRETSQNDKVEYAVSRIVSDALDLCYEKFKIHGIELEINVDQDLVMNCRPTEIAQVLVNLLNNSYDAIEKLDTKKISVNTKILDDETFEISVTDSGKGIPPEIQDKIMQPFFTTKEFGKGTGIGLSISKGIIESHDGALYVDRYAPTTRMVIVLPFVIAYSMTLAKAN